MSVAIYDVAVKMHELYMAVSDAFDNLNQEFTHEVYEMKARVEFTDRCRDLIDFADNTQPNNVVTRYLFQLESNLNEIKDERGPLASLSELKESVYRQLPFIIDMFLTGLLEDQSS